MLTYSLCVDIHGTVVFITAVLRRFYLFIRWILVTTRCSFDIPAFGNKSPYRLLYIVLCACYVVILVQYFCTPTLLLTLELMEERRLAFLLKVS